VTNKVSRPGSIHLRIVEVLKRFPDGIAGGQIRQELEREGLRPEDQTHLDRRKRDLKKWFVIEKVKSTQEADGKKRTVILYKYRGKKRTDLGQRQSSSSRAIGRAPPPCRMDP
jgi:hypothetical protein